ncbi:hypothetical protein KIW84_065102 [Lathyrus oleraceus]|uniref:Uncharacterized protein n=1 Tax=Pisum sativum TaxID=3888 RepID=A0A9D5ABY6_PEA|nr:hypothetical protein KIW84_065102 [Pisum sativum]
MYDRRKGRAPSTTAAGSRWLSGSMQEAVTSLSKIQMAKDPVRVLVTGTARQLGYALVPMISRRAMLGPE